MTASPRIIVLIALIAVLLLPATAAAQPAPSQAPARDGRAPAAGNGSISGVVLSDDAEGRPIRRARVRVIAPELVSQTVTVTDDRGQFSLTDLPAGRFSMEVLKDTHPALAYGARRPGRPGTTIALGDGQRLTGLTIRLPRGAVITGTVVDQTGQPAQGVQVRAARYHFMNGRRRLSTVFAPGGITDDRGTYRIYGLAAGEYVVSGAPHASSVLGSAQGGIELTTAADVARARRALSAPAAVQSTPGAAGVYGGPASSPVTRRTAGYAPVYYPGTTVATQAAAITVAAGEERTGVDIQLQLTPTTTVEGLVAMPDGSRPQNLVVTLVSAGMPGVSEALDSIRSNRPGADGRFSFGGVTPGAYVLTARAATRAQPGSNVWPPIAPLWAMADIVVDGQPTTTSSSSPRTARCGRRRHAASRRCGRRRTDATPCATCPPVRT